ETGSFSKAAERLCKTTATISYRIKLQVLPLSQEAFSAYGDVIETQQRDFFHINNGLVERYHDLALVEILEQDRTLISINRAQPANLPLRIATLTVSPESNIRRRINGPATE
ncbi:ureidoglycolate lyase, partial [Escherichia sp. HC-CC]